MKLLTRSAGLFEAEIFKIVVDHLYALSDAAEMGHAPSSTRSLRALLACKWLEVWIWHGRWNEILTNDLRSEYSSESAVDSDLEPVIDEATASHLAKFCYDKLEDHLLMIEKLRTLSAKRFVELCNTLAEELKHRQETTPKDLAGPMLEHEDSMGKAKTYPQISQLSSTSFVGLAKDVVEEFKRRSMSRQDDQVTSAAEAVSTLCRKPDLSKQSSSLVAVPGVQLEDASTPISHKRFRIGLDDPCWKVLTAAVHDRKIPVDWRQYSLYIVHDNKERLVGLYEKPFAIIKDLDVEHIKPVLMLRKNVPTTQSDDIEDPTISAHSFINEYSSLEDAEDPAIGLTARLSDDYTQFVLTGAKHLSDISSLSSHPSLRLPSLHLSETSDCMSISGFSIESFERMSISGNSLRSIDMQLRSSNGALYIPATRNSASTDRSSMSWLRQTNPHEPHIARKREAIDQDEILGCLGESGFI